MDAWLGCVYKYHLEKQDCGSEQYSGMIITRLLILNNKTAPKDILRYLGNLNMDSALDKIITIIFWI